MAEIHEAVVDILRQDGLNVLNDCKGFKERMLDMVGTDSRNGKVIRVGCDAKYLEMFVRASGNASCETLENAAREAAAYLEDEYVINPQDASRVSNEIAEGCAEFLGLQLSNCDDVKEDNGAKGKNKSSNSTLRTVLISSSVFVVFAIVAAVIAAHYVPYLGCTLLPQHKNVAGVECSWYVASNSNGNACGIVYLENTTQEALSVKSRNSVFYGEPVSMLPPSYRGIMLVSGNYGIKNLAVSTTGQKLAIVNKSIVDSLEWKYIPSESKDESSYIELHYSGDEPFRLRKNGIVVASRGLKAWALAYPIESYNEQFDSDTKVFYIDAMKSALAFGDNYHIDENTEVYVNGVLIPRAQN